MAWHSSIPIKGPSLTNRPASPGTHPASNNNNRHWLTNKSWIAVSGIYPSVPPLTLLIKILPVLPFGDACFSPIASPSFRLSTLPVCSSTSHAKPGLQVLYIPFTNSNDINSNKWPATLRKVLHCLPWLSHLIFTAIPGRGIYHVHYFTEKKQIYGLQISSILITMKHRTRT